MKDTAKGPRGRRNRRVRIGGDDPSVTGSAGLVLVAEVDRILGVASTIDAWVGRIKQRDRGLVGAGAELGIDELTFDYLDYLCVDIERVEESIDVIASWLKRYM